jgi:transcriptional regulator with XRE-family HTH domain
MRRTMLGMSQEALGEALGITFQQVQKYERGVNRMGASRLYDVAKLLNVNVAFFFEQFEKSSGETASVAEESPAFEHEKIASRETLEIMRAYYRIEDANIRRRVSELVKALAEDVPVA